MDARGFFRILYLATSISRSAFVSLFNGSTKKSEFVSLSELDRAALVAEKWVASEQDVYFGIGLRGEDLGPHHRGAAHEIVALPGLWLDIDCGGGHKATNLPSVDQALSWLSVFHHVPTLTVHSGRGLHAYWLFDELRWLDTETDRAEARHLCLGFEAHVRTSFDARGWHLDTVADLPRLLRVPSTQNFKQKDLPRPVVVMPGIGPRHAYADLLSAFGKRGSRRQPEKNSVSSGALDVPDPDPVLALPEVELRQRLERLRKPEQRELAARILQGRALADEGGRNSALWGAAAILTTVDRHASPESLAEVLRPALAAMESAKQDPANPAPTFDEAVEKLERARVGAWKRHQAQEARDAGLMNFFAHRGDPMSAPTEDDNLLRGDDTEVATRELTLLGFKSGEPSDVVAVHGQLYCFEPSGGWVPRDREHLRRQLTKYGKMFIHPPGLNAKGEPHNRRPFMADDRRLSNITNLMLTSAARHDFFDQAVPGVAFRNGFVVVEDDRIVLRPHSRENRALHLIDADYDPGRTAPRWTQFLEEIRISTGASSFLHEFTGACLFRDIVKHKLCVGLLGDTDAGKSVFLDTTISLFPPSAVASLTPSEWSSRFGPVGLLDAMVNVVDEMPAAKISETERFKSIVSGGLITAERKNEQQFQFRSRCGHIFAANKLPPTSEEGDAVFRRWAIVPFPRRFLPSEMDADLRDKLKPEIPQIIALCIAAYVNLKRRGRFLLSEDMERAKETWVRETDHVYRFIKLVLRRSENPTPTEKLYAAFMCWAQKTENLGSRDLRGQSAFGKAMARLGFKSTRSGQARGWYAEVRTFAGIAGATIEDLSL